MAASDSGKLCFTELSWWVYWNRSLASSEPFHLFTQSINFYTFHCRTLISIRFSRPEVFLRKGVLKICSKSTGEHPFREVWFQYSCETTLLKLHFVTGVLLYICCIFSEHLFLGTPLGCCFCIVNTSRSTDAWIRWFTRLTEYERFFLSATFTAKLEWAFVLTQESAFS